MSDKPRYSQYLTEKAAALEKTLDFFLKDTGTHRRSVNETLLVFLDQIFFWDWEMDELRYSFDSFKTRSKSWQEDGAGIAAGIESQVGVKLRPKVADGIDFNRYCRKYGSGPVEAPYDACNKVIDKWNRLLKRCEERILVDAEFIQTYKDKFSCMLEPDLKKFVKKVVTEPDAVV